METPQSFSEGCALQGEVVNWIHVSFTRIISASLTASSGKIYYNNLHNIYITIAISIKHIIGRFYLQHQENKMHPLYMSIFFTKIFLLQYSLVKAVDIAVSCLSLF